MPLWKVVSGDPEKPSMTGKGKFDSLMAVLDWNGDRAAAKRADLEALGLLSRVAG